MTDGTLKQPKAPRRWQQGDSRRGSGEGAVYQLADGTWITTIELGRNPKTGKRYRKTVKGKTKAEVLRRRKDAAKLVDGGGTTGGGTITVGALLDDWLTTVVEGRVDSDNTVANYRIVVDKHLKPTLGAIRLDKLVPEQVDKLLAHKAKEGKLDVLTPEQREKLIVSGRELGLSRSYISRMRVVLADALGHAERRGLVVRNVATLSVMPKTLAGVKRRSFTADEARAVIRAASGQRRAARSSPCAGTSSWDAPRGADRTALGRRRS